jgi:hypothetical protein
MTEVFRGFPQYFQENAGMHEHLTRVAITIQEYLVNRGFQVLVAFHV